MSDSCTRPGVTLNVKMGSLVSPFAVTVKLRDPTVALGFTVNGTDAVVGSVRVTGPKLTPLALTVMELSK
jgi:hypothetical protein